MEIAVEIEVFRTSLWIPFDTAAKSIWVDQTWLKERGGIVNGNPGKAIAAYGRYINASGKSVLSFRMWSDDLIEDVRVMETLLDIIQIGQDFWLKHGLELSFSTNISSILSNRRSKTSAISYGLAAIDEYEPIQNIIEDDEVDEHLETLDLTTGAFSHFWSTVCASNFQSAHLAFKL